MVEFAMMSIVAMLLTLVGIQYALIGQAAVAVSQGTAALARYAANNPGAVGDSTGNGTITMTAAMEQLLSPTICPTGTSCPALTATITSYQGTTNTVDTATPQFGDRLVINLSYSTTSKLALPNPFLKIPGVFPGLTFPTAVGASDSQMYE